MSLTFYETVKSWLIHIGETSLIQIQSSDRILTSACLLGVNCRYDANNCFRKEILRLTQTHFIIPVCPEQLGGLSTPRRPCEFKSGDGLNVLENQASIFNDENINCTEQFLKGAAETLELIKLFEINVAVLKQRSPSCGFGIIYRNGELVPGIGVTAALIQQIGVKIKAIE